MALFLWDACEPRRLQDKGCNRVAAGLRNFLDVHSLRGPPRFALARKFLGMQRKLSERFCE